MTATAWPRCPTCTSRLNGPPDRTCHDCLHPHTREDCTCGYRLTHHADRDVGHHPDCRPPRRRRDVR